MNDMSAELSSTLRTNQNERVAMYHGNALNIGLFGVFGANCSSGRAVTTGHH